MGKSPEEGKHISEAQLTTSSTRVSDYDQFRNDRDSAIINTNNTMSMLNNRRDNSTRSNQNYPNRLYSSMVLSHLNNLEGINAEEQNESTSSRDNPIRRNQNSLLWIYRRSSRLRGNDNNNTRNNENRPPRLIATSMSSSINNPNLGTNQPSSHTSTDNDNNSYANEDRVINRLDRLNIISQNPTPEPTSSRDNPISNQDSLLARSRSNTNQPSSDRHPGNDSDSDTNEEILLNRLYELSIIYQNPTQQPTGNNNNSENS